MSRRSRAITVVAVVAVLAAIGAVFASRIERDPDRPRTIVPRQDPVADLLAWIPQDEQLRRQVMVWTPDSGQSLGLSDTLELTSEIGFDPVPRTLGQGAAWRAEFGWDASQVDAWAMAGVVNQLVILRGEFDIAEIEDALKRSGYEADTYHGAQWFELPGLATPQASVGGDEPSAAHVIAVLNGRLITSRSSELVRAAVDAAVGERASLADDPLMAETVSSLAPLSALAAFGLQDSAAGCRGQNMATDATSGEGDDLVVVGYGRLGADGARRTLIAVSFPDAIAASTALPKYSLAWQAGLIDAQGTGGDLSSFGTLTSVAQSGRLNVAELVNGRDDGWVRAGIRFALPVCSSVIPRVGDATPVPAP